MTSRAAVARGAAPRAAAARPGRAAAARAAAGLLACAAAACSGDDGDRAGQAGTPDAGTPPGEGPDAGEGDGARRPPGPLPNVGTRCDPARSTGEGNPRANTDCTNGALCARLRGGVGVCVTTGCTALSPVGTPVRDSCRDRSPDHACVDLSDLLFEVGGCDGEGRDPNECEADNWCLRRCRVGDRNACERDVACHPMFSDRTDALDSRQDSVCFSPSCVRDEQACFERGARPCDPALDDKDCGPGEFCHTDPLGPVHRCARSAPDRCDIVSGLCRPRATGDPQAAIGDPCQADADCPPGAECFQERPIDRDGDGMPDDAIARAGSCTVRYCLQEKAVQAFACPSGSACNRRWPWGFCQRTCDPGDSFGCRGRPFHPELRPDGDRMGDYECVPLPVFELEGGMLAADEAVCEFGSTEFDCDDQEGIWCETLAPGFACTDPDTGEPTEDPRDPAGLCLDRTRSGPPREQWRDLSCADPDDCSEDRECRDGYCRPRADSEGEGESE